MRRQALLSPMPAAMAPANARVLRAFRRRAAAISNSICSRLSAHAASQLSPVSAMRSAMRSAR